MKDRLRAFMMGRYGNDQLNQFLCIIAIILMIADVIAHSTILWTISLVLLIVIYARTLSKNIYKRSAENEFYLEKKDALFGFFSRKKSYAQQAKDFHIYKCPNCKQKIRIPRGKGKIRITCPKCHTSFEKRS